MKALITSILLTIITVSSLALATEKKVLYWVAPMNPNYRMDKPGKSPMGMDLVPVYAEEETIATNETNDKQSKARVSISPETIQNMGVRTEKAQMAIFGSSIRSYGEITENIRLQSDISSRISGWIKELKVKAVGDKVQKGELLFKLDSPELISAQQDYISAIKSQRKWRINAAETRLESLGVQDMAIAKIAKQGNELSYTPFYAVQDGIVSEINIREGSYVKPGMTVMKIQDYSSVWVDVSIAEKDIPYINKATKVTVILPNLGIKSQQATIDYIHPTIDRKTRTGHVRLVLDNSSNLIKPGAYADIEFQSKMKPRLSIPSNAILKSKEGDYVVVSIGNGRFQPHKILTGVHYKDRTEVLEGVSIDDDIVISGQFLIDSESSLLGSFDKMKQMQTALKDLELSNKQLVMINKLIISRALSIHRTLSQNKIPYVSDIFPATNALHILIPMFRGTALEFILEDANRILISSYANITYTEWQTTLNKLVIALKPWILEGRPEYYKSENLILYEDSKLNKYWLQITEKPINIYGPNKSIKIQ